MRVRYTFEVMDLDDERVAVPVGSGAEQFHGVLKVNETAAAILKLMEQDTTEEQIVDALMKEYEGERDAIAGYVRQFVEKLTAEGLVD